MGGGVRGRGAREDAGGQDDAEGVAALVEGAELAAAARAGLEVSAEGAELPAGRLAVEQPGQEGQVLLALCTRLDGGDVAGEARAALGQAAIHLCVRPPGLRHDLGVAQPRGLEPERADLVGLEAAQGCRVTRDVVGGEGSVLGGVGGARLEAVELGLVGPDELAALAAHGQGFVLEDGEQPPVRARRLEPASVADVDLQRALVGLVGVVGAEGVPACHPQEVVGVALDGGDDHRLGLRGGAERRGRGGPAARVLGGGGLGAFGARHASCSREAWGLSPPQPSPM